MWLQNKDSSMQLRNIKCNLHYQKLIRGFWHYIKELPCTTQENLLFMERQTEYKVGKKLRRWKFGLDHICSSVLIVFFSPVPPLLSPDGIFCFVYYSKFPSCDLNSLGQISLWYFTRYHTGNECLCCGMEIVF